MTTIEKTERKNKVRYGLNNLHIAFIDPATGEFDAPKRWMGAVSLKASPEGDENKSYADDGVYWFANSNNGYKGDLEMALFPDDIQAEMYGWELDKNGALIEVSEGIAKNFALIFEIDGDVNKRRGVYYNCNAARPEDENKTKEDKIDPTTQKASITMMPIDIAGKKVVKAAIEPSDANKGVYDSFFTKVYVPDSVVTEPVG